jgi:pyruvate,water dikinase
MFKEILPYLGAGVMSFNKVEKIFIKNKIERSDFVKLVKGIEGNITAEMGLLYDDVLLYYGTDKGEELFQSYIELFGIRTDGEIDLGRPRPIDDLAAFKEQVKKMAEVHSGISLREKHTLSVVEGQEVIKKLENNLSAKEFKKLQHWIQVMKAYYILREHPKHTMMRIFYLYRQYISSLFESFEEKSQGGVTKALIDERKNTYTQAFGKKIPLAMLSNGLILKSKKNKQDGSIIGFGVSSGIITAKVRVIENIHDDMIQDGEILVTRFTDPGWTPMLAKAGGIITEVGGLMTHGAIVAREYGLPAVVGIEDALTLFKTGELITIDGDSGVVTKLA